MHNIASFGYLILALNRQQLEALTPAISKMVSAAPQDYIGIIITLKADGKTLISDGVQYDFWSRFFAPWCGVDEDPVTGLLHMCYR